MNGTAIPKFYEGEKLPQGYYDTPDPFVRPKCNLNLLELSRYALSHGKELVSLTKEEISQFKVNSTS